MIDSKALVVLIFQNTDHALSLTEGRRDDNTLELNSESNVLETGVNLNYISIFSSYRAAHRVNHTVIGHLIVIGQWRYIILW